MSEARIFYQEDCNLSLLDERRSNIAIQSLNKCSLWLYTKQIQLKFNLLNVYLKSLLCSALLPGLASHKDR